jgi:rod shape-determining protein MreD
MHRIVLGPVMLIILSAGLIQATSFDFIRLFGVKPDLVLILTIFAVLLFDRKEALRCAATAGVIQDITSSALFGSHVLSFLLCSLILNAHQNKFYRERPLAQMILSFSAYIFVSVFVVLLNAIAYRQQGLFYGNICVILKGAAYTCFAAPPVFLALSRILHIELA